MNLTRQRT